MTRRRSRGALMGLSVAGLLAALLAAGVIVFASPLARSTGLRTAGRQPSTIAPSLFAPPTPSTAPEQQSGDGVVDEPEPVTPRATLAGSALQRQLSAIKPQHGGRSSIVVIDHASGTVLANQGGQQLMLPASNLKTLVTMAVLEKLGPGHRFTTSVVQTSPGTIVLVGGGDPYLGTVHNPTRPTATSTLELATLTAAALKQAGVTSVSLGYDDTLFSGPDWHPSWPAGYSDQVARISSLSLDAGRTVDQDGVRVPGTGLSQQPAAETATRFAQQLRAAGITITGKVGRRAVGEKPATELAAVQSMPLIDIATEVMVHSDNFGAEVLFRQLALAAGQPGSFAGASSALQHALTADGLWTKGAVTTDGSGLSRDNRVTALMLASAWQKISRNDSLKGLLVSTPVAGVSGTLADRFRTDSGAAVGRGWVHAKTGTLTGVSTLSGWTVSTDGQPLILAIMVNDSTNDWFARLWIDQVASAATGCGCR
ncbi:D-alanyl-D-alanine carboxypeptidase/D-alanyl-D-alanine endopeptidase [Aestuariimicrobium soli]|uniref:D-alanyl-D-alanine carboxypeptidase/D-alanyl-D-alanine endopeptidase n=1 Tax=Aestuariimicrobium soli TaxID=2035834 RepID=UPI003EBCDA62